MFGSQYFGQLEFGGALGLNQTQLDALFIEGATY